MKYLFSLFLLTLCFKQLSAQEKHFVFIQSDNKQPFYVSVNGKLFSSSASGYVIIPKLVDGTYSFSVGFAQNTFPEQNFQLSIDKKDLGYNLKNFTDKGWGLFNLQTLDVTMAGSMNTNNVAKALSESAQNSSGEPVLTFDKKKVDTVATTVAAPVADTVAVARSAEDTMTPVATASAKTPVDSVAQTTAPLVHNTDRAEVKTEDLAGVKKVSEVKVTDGVRLSYIETTGKKTDTIQVIIPSNNSIAASANNAEVQTVADTTKSASVANDGSSKKEVKFLDMDITSSQKSEAAAGNKQTPVSLASATNNCKDIATDDDYARLRKKMANESTDDEMIAVAKKYYKNKCFTTSQVKALSTLFLSDQGRYKFFESSYASVSDATLYSSLQTEFIDPAFVARFKSLIQ